MAIGLGSALDIGILLSQLPKLFHRPSASDQQTKEKLANLVKEGKVDELAEEVLGSWGLGFGLKDEMRLLRDVCNVIDGEKLTVKQGYAIMLYLMTLTESHREKFREAYVSESDVLKRQRVLVVLGKLPNDGYRNAFLQGAGMFDPSDWEKVLQALESPIEAIADLAKKNLFALRRRHLIRLAQQKNAALEDKEGWFIRMLKFKIW